jgi:hypothetical protein
MLLAYQGNAKAGETTLAYEHFRWDLLLTAGLLNKIAALVIARSSMRVISFTPLS